MHFAHSESIKITQHFFMSIWFTYKKLQFYTIYLNTKVRKKYFLNFIMFLALLLLAAFDFSNYILFQKLCTVLFLYVNPTSIKNTSNFNIYGMNMGDFEKYFITFVIFRIKPHLSPKECF